VQLLIGRGLAKGIDYDREVGQVKVSIKEVIQDFILPKLSLAIEVKLAKTDTKARSIVDEINADIQAYGRKYDQILFIVHDVGSIRAR
jgi:REase_DpnII-MboI